MNDSSEECNVVEVGRAKLPSMRRPTEFRRLLDLQAVEQHRDVFCAGYDDCLDEALDRRWANWSCEACRLFRPLHRAPRVRHEAESEPEAQ